MKIHILGGAGSGKTFIAELLSLRLGIQHYDLDDIFWDDSSANGYGIKTPEQIRDQNLQEIIRLNSWIVEGVYLSWVEPSFAAADKIFVLIPPLNLQEERIWNRYQARISGTVPSKKKETYEGVQQLLKWNRDYNERKLSHFVKHCVYRDKMIIVDDNMKIVKFFENKDN